jgi:hypothetical protein
VAAVVGCGGGGGDDASADALSGNSGPADFYCALGTVLLGGVCVSESGSSSSVTSVSAGVPGDSGDCGPITQYALTGDPRVFCGEPPFAYPDEEALSAMTTLELALDLEPNDDLATAAAMPIDTLIYDVLKTSIATLGMLSAGSDDIDTYIFTASQGVRIDVELCYDRHYPCGQGTPQSTIDVDVAHIEVLDQFGTLLATTVNDSVNGNLLSITVDGGVPYYVTVVASNLPTTQSYYLRLSRAALSAESVPAESSQPNAPNLSFYNEAFLTGETTLTATLYWDAPTLNTDGTPLLDLQGYVLSYGRVPDGSDPYQQPIYDYREPLDLGLSAYTLTLPEYGTWWIVMTAANADGVESEPSVALILTYVPAEST